MMCAAVWIGLFGMLVVGTLPASAQEAHQRLDCFGRDQGHPDCTRAYGPPAKTYRRYHRPNAGSGHSARPPRTISGTREPASGSGQPRNGRVDAVVRASRTFVAPGQYPPEQFAAYGIVAFPSRPNRASRERYILVCREYWSALSASSELDIPPDQQMVTVWPVATLETAEYLSVPGAEENCEQAVDDYHLGTAQTAIRHAEIADGEPRSRRGPYLLAWAPPTEKGHEGVLVLSIDLSSANAPEHFADSFRRWREQIEMQPELWQRGWSVDEVRNAIRDWVDDVGNKIATLSVK
jgi:hypothetical protein